MTETKTDPFCVAHHEAGHAVVGFALGRGFKRATIVPGEDGESLGHVAPRVLQFTRKLDRRSPTAREEQRLLDDIVFRLAGAQAECRFRGVELRQVLGEGGAEHDYAEIPRFAEILEPSLVPRAALLDYLDARAADLVELHWFLIETLASELAARRTLSGPAVYRLLRATVLEQPEADEQGLAPDDPPERFRAAADWIGRSRRGLG